MFAALDSGDVEEKITYCRHLGELCAKSADGHATALSICDQLKVPVVFQRGILFTCIKNSYCTLLNSSGCGEVRVPYISSSLFWYLACSLIFRRPSVNSSVEVQPSAVCDETSDCSKMSFKVPLLLLTYNVFSGTLNPTHSLAERFLQTTLCLESERILSCVLTPL